MIDAVYVASVDKIFGTVESYALQFNATTGARENFVRVASPLYGNCRICYHAATDSLYVSTYNQPNLRLTSLTTWPARDVFPVSTSLVVGAGLDMNSFRSAAPPYNGYGWIASAGSHLYLSHQVNGYFPVRFNPTNLADRNSQFVSIPIWEMQMGGFSPTQIAVPRNYFRSIYSAPILFDLSSDWTSSDITPFNPVGCEYCAVNGLFYVVCGDTNLLRINVLTPINFTVLNLGGVEASADPVRLRYRALDGMLYLPCQTANAVIVWNPLTDTGVLKSGFDSPIDVVFTPTKAFAVQLGAASLKEIT